jgi:hypothetical protein
MGHASQVLDVANVARWITDTFAKDSPRLVVNQFFYIAGVIGRREADGDSLIWQNIREECVGGAIKHRNRDDIGAHPDKIGQRIMDSRLA